MKIGYYVISAASKSTMNDTIKKEKIRNIIHKFCEAYIPIYVISIFHFKWHKAVEAGPGLDTRVVLPYVET